MDDAIVSPNLEVTRATTPLLGLKRMNQEESDHLQPIAPSAISNIDTSHGHKRQRSVPPDLSPLTIDTMTIPTSYSATATPTSLGEDFLARAGLDVASSTLASITTQDEPFISSIANANKPFKCTVPGCEKAYKNPNGLKYHNLHGHHGNDESDTEKRLRRPFECTIGSCRKRYKNLNGLKYHVEHSHLVVITNQLNNMLPHTPELSPASTP
ncbi:Transcription factor sfp1 [Umbelopsis sp. WA50703]